MSRQFNACLRKVHNRGQPPVQFMKELIDWGRGAPDEIFERNPNNDIYSLVVGTLAFGTGVSDHGRGGADGQYAHAGAVHSLGFRIESDRR